MIDKSRLSATFELTTMNETNEQDIDATKLADKAKNEMKHLRFIKDYYPVLSSEEMTKSCCPTLITFLSLISSKFLNSKVAVLISKMITGVVTSKIFCFKYPWDC